MNPQRSFIAIGVLLLAALSVLVHADPYYGFYGVGQAMAGGGTSTGTVPVADGGGTATQTPTATPTITPTPTVLAKPAIAVCGDICVPYDGVVNRADLDCLINYAFSGAAAPIPLWIADVNGDGIASDVFDVNYLSNYLYASGPAPKCDPSMFATPAPAASPTPTPSPNATVSPTPTPSPTTVAKTSTSSIILHRITKECSSDMVLKTEEKFPVGPGTGYDNYKCASRKQEQCYDDGTYDEYYDEWCDYPTTGELTETGGPVCGDICVPYDGVVNRADLDCLINYAFSGAAAPIPLWIADVNGDGIASDVFDVNYISDYLYGGGPALKCDPSKFGGAKTIDGGVVTIPVPAINPASGPLQLHRTIKDCATDKAFGAEQVFPVGPGTKYANYKCASRKQEQCYDDGSFDKYYDEWCAYPTGEKVPVTTSTTAGIPPLPGGIGGGISDIPPMPDGSTSTASSSSGGGRNPEIDESQGTPTTVIGQPAYLPPRPTPAPKPSCTESDGGANYYVKGKAIDSGNPQTYFDICSGKILTEYYCESNTVHKAGHTCAYGCKDGACVMNAPDSFSTFIDGMANFLNRMFS